MNEKTALYIVPALKRLSGLIHYYGGISPEGTAIQISIWDSEEHSAQLNTLKEMAVDGRRDMESVGVKFTPIVTVPVDDRWTLSFAP